MFHLERNRPEAPQLFVAPVDSLDNLHSLSAFLNLVGSCSGPNGRLHMIRNACGGHVTMTSDSGRLLASLSLSRQILKLLVSSVQAHLSVYGDGGKFLAFVCLSLVISTVKQTEEFKNRRAFCVLNEHFVKIVSNYLNSEECSVCVKADLTDLQVLLAYTHSVLLTRPLLNLTKSDYHKVIQLIVRCFVESIPMQELSSEGRHSNGIFIVGSQFKHVTETELLKGLLIEYPDLSCMKGELAINLATVCTENSKGNNCFDSSERQIKVILVTCSMSGDLEEIVSVTYELTETQASAVETMVLEKWTHFCEKLALSQVGLILCQKVIHPRLKILLKSYNIVVVDRLGSAVIPYVTDLTGAKPVVSVITEDSMESFEGYISGAKHIILNKKSYLHLVQPSSSVVSLIVCSKTEERLEEFKCCIKTALKGLYSLLHEGKLLAGAGCWQIHCSHKLDEEVKKCLPSLAKTAGCSEAQVLSALSIFRSSVFHHWVQQLHKGHQSLQSCWELLGVDAVGRHCWRVPNGPSNDERQLSCCCGLTRTDVICTGQDKFQKIQPLPLLNPSQSTFNSKNAGRQYQTPDQSCCMSTVSKELLKDSLPVTA